MGAGRRARREICPQNGIFGKKKSKLQKENM
jgi:hypothetical protein